MTDGSGQQPRSGRLGPLPSSGRPRRRPPSRWLSALIGIGVLSALAGTAVLVAERLERRAERDDRAAAGQRLATAAEIARLKRVQAPHRSEAPALRPPPGATRSERLAARRALLDAVRRSILADARRRARRGELEGPITAVSCGTILRDPRAVPDHLLLSHTVGRYDCLAEQPRSLPRIAVGHPFVAALDFRRYTYVWCRNTPPPSERGEALAFVRLERPCLAARGRALGTGYAQTPEQKQGR